MDHFNISGPTCRARVRVLYASLCSACPNDRGRPDPGTPPWMFRTETVARVAFTGGGRAAPAPPGFSSPHETHRCSHVRHPRLPAQRVPIEPRPRRHGGPTPSNVYLRDRTAPVRSTNTIYIHTRGPRSPRAVALGRRTQKMIRAAGSFYYGHRCPVLVRFERPRARSGWAAAPVTDQHQDPGICRRRGRDSRPFGTQAEHSANRCPSCPGPLSCATVSAAPTPRCGRPLPGAAVWPDRHL